MATNYTGILTVSGSSHDTAGDSTTFSGSFGVTLSTTLDPSGNGTATETIGGNGSTLSYSWDYTAINYGTGSGSVPFSFSTPPVTFVHGTYASIPIRLPVTISGAYFYADLAVSFTSQGHITEHLTAYIAGYNQEHFHFTGTLVGDATLACFAEGTHLATTAGPRAVETLREGDLLWAASGRLAPVRWLGRRHLDPRRHPRRHDVMPVRVRAGAFADFLPATDLLLSPDHAVLLDGVLVPVRHLVNGLSIAQEHCDSVTYWHVELDRHDAVLAEGLPCETYLDTGNRGAFENAAAPTELHPDFAPQDHARRVWNQRGCAPILTDPADPRLRAIHLRLLGHANRAPSRREPARA